MNNAGTITADEAATAIGRTSSSSLMFQGLKNDLDDLCVGLSEALKAVESAYQLEEDEIHDMLFKRWDENNDGKVSVKELAKLFLSYNPERGAYEAVHAAMVTVLQFDIDADAELGKAEAKALVCKLMEEIGLDLKNTAGLLLLAPYHRVAEKYRHEILHRREAIYADPSAVAANDFADAKHDARMRELFVLFDHDLDEKIEFKELTVGLMKLTPNFTLSKAKETAVQALLMCDSTSSRQLSYYHFAQFIVNFCIVGGFRFNDVADMLVYRAASSDPSDCVFSELQEFMDSDVMATICNKKIHVIFNTFDEDGDGNISFSELVKLIRLFEPIRSRKQAEMDAVKSFLHYDSDKNQHLDKIEFAAWLTSYTTSTNSDINEVLDFLLAASTLGKHAETVWPSRWWTPERSPKRPHLEMVEE